MKSNLFEEIPRFAIALVLATLLVLGTVYGMIYEAGLTALKMLKNRRISTKKPNQPHIPVQIEVKRNKNDRGGISVIQKF